LVNSSSRFKIIVDAMGGDYAPDEIIIGAKEASRSFDVDLQLIGNEGVLREAAEKLSISFDSIELIDASDKVTMDDSPSDVLKHRKNSSINKGTRIASEHSNSAFVSAGNTGAVMACSLFNMGKIEGISRPAITLVIPLAEKKFVLIDAGANVEIKPAYLEQFAVMGKVYCREILKIEDPRIGLLNVGSEEKKGSEIVVEGHRLIKNNSRLNFIGNVEGRDIFEGKADVVVCDGFVGNIILKAVEGMAGLFFNEIKEVFKTSAVTKISALMVKRHLKNMKDRFDYEEHGGAILLGINGITIISHGSSKSRAIYNAVKAAYKGLNGSLIDNIKQEIKN
jgi:glycerol-3-phosphate acyltransferase PlsX